MKTFHLGYAFFCLVMGGLIYQGCRVALGYNTTWDTFLETTAFYAAVLLIIRVARRFA